MRDARGRQCARLTGLLLADDLRARVQREAMKVESVTATVDWPPLLYARHTSAQQQASDAEQRDDTLPVQEAAPDDGMCPIGVWDPREAAIALGDPKVKQPLVFAQSHGERAHRRRVGDAGAVVVDDSPHVSRSPFVGTDLQLEKEGSDEDMDGMVSLDFANMMRNKKQGAFSVVTATCSQRCSRRRRRSCRRAGRGRRPPGAPTRRPSRCSPLWRRPRSTFASARSSAT